MSYLPKNLEEFSRLATQGNIIPVVKTIVADLLTPVSAYLRLKAESPYSFLLESIVGGEHLARYSFIGYNPKTIMRSRNNMVEVWQNGEPQQAEGTFFDLMRQYFQPFKPVKVDGLPPFTGGGVGYLGYDTVRWFEKIPDKNSNTLEIADACLMFFSAVLAFDHVKQQITIIVNLFIDEDKRDLATQYQQAIAEIAIIEKLLAAPLPTIPKPASSEIMPWHSNMTQTEFENAVIKAKEYIKLGDIFQVVLSQRFETSITTQPFQIYRALRTLNPSPYMFYLNFDDTALIGSSPELLVRADYEKLAYRPIAGTRIRGANELEDQLLSEELRADEKEIAEHVMLVDLGRNDLGRVSEFGSVDVVELMVVEKYSHVMHLVSGLRGQLRQGYDRFDALAACFPAGTVSGAPKVRAMEIIDELEPTRRGPYAGAVLYLDYAGNLDSCISIRTLVVKDGKAYMQAGAGIVADSVPEKEYQETVNKARAIMRAIEIANNEL